MNAQLSDDARAIAGGLFGLPMPCRNAVQFTMPWALTARAADALCELVDAGMISRRVLFHGIVYAEVQGCREHYDWLRAEMHTGVGSFEVLREGGR